MENPDQDTINSLFEAIVTNDNNASVTIEALRSDYNLLNLKRIIEIPENAHKQAGMHVMAQDPLDIYLHTVYHSKPKCLDLFLDMKRDHKVVSEVPKNNYTAISQFSESLGTLLIIEGGNDVCWAILSNHDIALKNLKKAYSRHNLAMDINARTAIPASNFDLRNEDAKKHTPLDIAVMRYVAEKRADIYADMYKEEILPSQIKEHISPILEQFGGAGRVNAAVIDLGNEAKSNAPSTAENIRILLNMGAKGSTAAYFPASEGTLNNPFMGEGAFRVKSLSTFCEQNSNLFESEQDILDQLVNSEPLIKPTL
ncbi:MAG: hypothetical protein OEY94_00430 [Alphaproteobacteria bacterium]|nr:hypothetical protein [Alphaproteobacteria bacterium]